MKLLFYMLIGIFLLYALPFVVARVVEVSGSDEGLWQTYPHSGFCPDSPGEVGRRKFEGGSVNNAAQSAGNFILQTSNFNLQTSYFKLQYA